MYMKILSAQRGFTLIEILAVVGMLLIVSVTGISAFSNYNKKQALSGAADMVLATLSEARSKTLASEGGYKYGVHFEETKIVIFRETYTAGAVDNKEFVFVGPVRISAITLVGGSDVIFKKISGETDNNGAAMISLKDNSGEIEIDIEKTGNSFILED